MDPSAGIRAGTQELLNAPFRIPDGYEIERVEWFGCRAFEVVDDGIDCDDASRLITILQTGPTLDGDPREGLILLVLRPREGGGSRAWIVRGVPVCLMG